jgi:DNA invertase Pin-like site-specific DNA recombinase
MTESQHLRAEAGPQLERLRKEGCAKIYREKASGAQPDRRELLKLSKAVAPGNVVTVTRIDRIARSTFDLFAIIKRIVDAGEQFWSLAEPWADTAISKGRMYAARRRNSARGGRMPCTPRFIFRIRKSAPKAS